jgi:hypothetical protein
VQRLQVLDLLLGLLEQRHDVIYPCHQQQASMIRE